MSATGRTLLVDASVFITLTDVGVCDLLYRSNGVLVVPGAVRDEVTDDPARSELQRAIDTGDVTVLGPGISHTSYPETYTRAMEYLNRPALPQDNNTALSGDIALLGEALRRTEVVVLTDDKPLRKACKALSIPVSGSLGVLIRAVERGDLGANEAKNKLVAMDEVGARLSARLLRQAEQLIDVAAKNGD